VQQEASLWRPERTSGSAMPSGQSQITCACVRIGEDIALDGFDLGGTFMAATGLLAQLTNVHRPSYAVIDQSSSELFAGLLEF
jgi:hypothetical protein